jgi:hypothetical protein
MCPVPPTSVGSCLVSPPETAVFTPVPSAALGGLQRQKSCLRDCRCRLRARAIAVRHRGDEPPDDLTMRPAAPHRRKPTYR